MMPKKQPVAVLILARDEELNLPDCLHSVSGWATQVAVVLDPRTQDASREVVAQAGAELYERPFEGYAQQKNWALAQVPWRADWILILDADERATPELVTEICAIVRDQKALEGYALRKRFIFYGTWMRHCWYSSWDLRFFKRGRARYESRMVHEHMLVDGKVGYLKSDLIHNDFKDLDSWIAKHNKYATYEAAEIVESSRGDQFKGRLFGSRLERRRFLKERVWLNLPFRPFWLFIYLYFIRLGILDGPMGFRFCLWHAIFDAFITAKVWEKKLLARGSIPNYYRKTLSAYLKAHPEAEQFYKSHREDGR
jgi:glycosyltransferase involved in cell wall biosynthesis